jgi:hypothetical protein
MELSNSSVISDKEAWQIACHEAAHAVIAVHHRFDLENVEMIDEENAITRPLGGPIEDLHKVWVVEEVRKWQEFYAAGIAAERLLFGEDRGHGWEVDKELHDKLERRYSRTHINAWEADIENTMKLLDCESVEKVAKELQLTRKLDGDIVYAILGIKPPWEEPDW